MSKHILPDDLDTPMRALMGLRLSDEFCRQLNKAEEIAIGLGWDDVVEELQQAHHHIHNAIKRCADDEDVLDALDEELVAVREKFEEFIEETKETF